MPVLVFSQHMPGLKWILDIYEISVFSCFLDDRTTFSYRQNLSHHGKLTKLSVIHEVLHIQLFLAMQLN